MTDLIDTTEMYLRTILELEEEGIPPLRARIVERLEHSGPTVSQTVARMERDGLVHVGADRRLELTVAGRERAVSVSDHRDEIDPQVASHFGNNSRHGALPVRVIHVESLAAQARRDAL